MRHLIDLFETQIKIPEEIYSDIENLSPDDVGRNEYDGWVLRYEGFSDWCIEDALDRCNLPKEDPRYLENFDAVYSEVQNGWNKEENSTPIETGFSGNEDNPVQWAIYKQ